MYQYTQGCLQSIWPASRCVIFWQHCGHAGVSPCLVCGILMTAAPPSRLSHLPHLICWGRRHCPALLCCSARLVWQCHKRPGVFGCMLCTRGAQCNHAACCSRGVLHHLAASILSCASMCRRATPSLYILKTRVLEAAVVCLDHHQGPAHRCTSAQPPNTLMCWHLIGGGAALYFKSCAAKHHGRVAFSCCASLCMSGMCMHAGCLHFATR